MLPTLAQMSECWKANRIHKFNSETVTCWTCSFLHLNILNR